MDRAKVEKVIRDVFDKGAKSPGVLSVPKLLSIKSKLERSKTIEEVIEILQDNQSFICKVISLSEITFDGAIETLKEMRS